MFTLRFTRPVCPAPQGAGRRGVRRRSGSVVLAVLALAGCYTYAPQALAPVSGTRVLLELNDRGRVALEQNIGPEIAAVEGIVESTSDTQLVLRVLATQSLYRSRTKWSGEVVTVRPEHFRTVRERRFSSGRTVALAGALASSTLAFVLTRTLFGGGTENDGGPGGGPPPGN